LVIAAKAGEKQAFTELFTRHRRRVLAVAQRITNNHADAEDVLQNAFLQAFRHLCKFDGRAQFSTWLTRIAINSALMGMRRNRVARAASLDDLATSDSYRLWDLKDPKDGIWVDLLQRERVASMETAIDELQPCLRSVIQIQRWHQGSVKQTAELAGLSLSATKSGLFRARRELRRRLQARY